MLQKLIGTVGNHGTTAHAPVQQAYRQGHARVIADSRQSNVKDQQSKQEIVTRKIVIVSVNYYICDCLIIEI